MLGKIFLMEHLATEQILGDSEKYAINLFDLSLSRRCHNLRLKFRNWWLIRRSHKLLSLRIFHEN